MDPLSAGASVLTFLGLALSSTRAVHAILSAVKDGPERVQRLTVDIEQLKDVLERLSQAQIGVIGTTDSSHVAGLVIRCSNDMNAFESKLQNFTLSLDDRRIGRFWKRLNRVISEKELGRISDILRTHSLSLNLAVSLVQNAKLSLSAEQTAESLDILKQLKLEVAGLRSSSAVSHDGTTGSQISGQASHHPDGTPVAQEPVDIELEESVNRLVTLVEKQDYTIDSDEEEQLIHDLEILLQAAQRSESSDLAAPRPAASNAARDAVTVSKELKLAGSLILSAPSIALNCTGTTTAISVPPGTVIDQQRKRKAIDMNYGTFNVFTTKRRRRAKSLADESSKTARKRERDFLTKITFKPQSSETIFTISIGQVEVLNNSLLRMPRLSINHIRQPDAEVFEVAASGSIEELQSMCAEGQASIGDRTPLGQSLLYVRANILPYLAGRSLMIL